MADAYNLCHIAAGDLVRLEMKQGTEVGKQVGREAGLHKGLSGAS